MERIRVVFSGVNSGKIQGASSKLNAGGIAYFEATKKFA